MKRKRKAQRTKKLNTLDKYIIFALSFITIFTIVHTVIFAFTGKEAKTLIIVVIGTLFSELLFCFFIKKFKLNEESKIVFERKKANMDVDDYIDEEGVE